MTVTPVQNPTPNAVKAIIRSLTPWVISAFVSALARFGYHVNAATTIQILASVGAGLTVVLHGLEAKYPWVGVLLGFKGAPQYAPTVKKAQAVQIQALNATVAALQSGATVTPSASTSVATTVPVGLSAASTTANPVLQSHVAESVKLIAKAAFVPAPSIPSAGSALDTWKNWMVAQLQGEGYAQADCVMAMDQYLTGEQVQNPALAQNIWSMIFSSGTVDPQYLPPGLTPPPQVVGANPTLVAALADAIAKGDKVLANAIAAKLGMPPLNDVAAPILKGSTPLTYAPVA